MEDGTTYDVRVYRTEVYKGAKVTTYWVRWKADGKVRKEPFRNAAQADSFRSSLLAAARNGEAFSLTTGRPVAWKRHVSSMSWYALTLAYTSAKWNYVSPNHRRGIAEALTDATEAMLTVDVHSRSARRGQAAHLGSHSTERDRRQSMINFGTYSAQPAAYACQEPRTAAHAMPASEKIVIGIPAGHLAFIAANCGGCGIRTHEDASTP